MTVEGVGSSLSENEGSNCHGIMEKIIIFTSNCRISLSVPSKSFVSSSSTSLTSFSSVVPSKSRT
jgi:hypothetical protein